MTKLLLIDDHTLMRDLLANELLKEDEIHEIAQAGSAEEAIAVFESTLFDMLIVDIAMPGMDGITLVEKMRTSGFDKPILILSMHKDRHLAQRALSAGATGMATKQDSLDDIVFAVKRTLAGERYLGPALVAENLLGRTLRNQSGLSSRECEVLILIASGKATKVIADELGLSPRTIDAHRRNIIAKTGVRNAADMTRLAREIGLSV